MSKDRRLGRGLAALLGTPLSDGTGGDGPIAEPAATIPMTIPLTNVPPLSNAQPSTAQPSSAPHSGIPLTTVPRATDIGRATDIARTPDSVRPSGASSDSGEGLAADASAELLHLRVDQIEENPFQPRRDFSEEEIDSLSESLKSHDLLQPVLVRRVGQGYQLISGERRLRAAVKAGWQTIPARVREADDRLVAELAIVENLQRKDLNAVEKALSFKRYLEQHRCTHDELAARLKLDRSTVSNLMRLLELPQQVLDAVRTGLISFGHARALLPLGETREQISYCERIVKEDLSVRDIERMVSEVLAAEDGGPVAGRVEKGGGKKTRSQQVAALEQDLRLALGTKIEIRTAAKGRGKIVIHFANHDEFDRIFEHLTDHSADRSEKRTG